LHEVEDDWNGSNVIILLGAPIWYWTVDKGYVYIVIPIEQARFDTWILKVIFFFKLGENLAINEIYVKPIEMTEESIIIFGKA
jgi:hypothetical protein